MKKVYLNHKLVNIEDANVSVLDRGYVFGDGVYEVIRFYNKKLFRADEHFDRFEASIKKIDIVFEKERKVLLGEMKELIEESGYHSGYIYLQITRGIGKRDHIYVGKELSSPQYMAYAVQEEERPLTIMENGKKVYIAEDSRWLHCDIKSLNLLGSVLVKNEAYKRGAQEAVLHRNGNITEGSATNVFAVKDGKLFTHPASNLILNGITRLAVIEVAKMLDIEVIEIPFSVQFFRQADEAFTTATVSEIAPIVEYEIDIATETLVRPVGSGLRGPVTKALQEAYSSLIY